MHLNTEHTNYSKDHLSIGLHNKKKELVSVILSPDCVLPLKW